MSTHPPCHIPLGTRTYVTCQWSAVRLHSPNPKVHISLGGARNLHAVSNRLPELFSGLERMELPLVVSYPTSGSPQAWAAASPLLMLRTLLRLDPWVPRGKVWLHPALPEQISRLYVGRIPLAGARVSVTVDGDKVTVDGLPDDLELVDAPRHPLTGT